MPRGIKSRESGTDFSVTDAIKRKKERMRQLESAAKSPNEHDVMNEVLERGDEDENVRRIFED